MVNLLHQDHPKQWLGPEHYQNVVVKWCTTDSKFSFQQNYRHPTTQHQLRQLGYNSESITYEYNVCGFRTKHFHDNGNSIVFLGCSFTAGIGLRYEDVYATLVSEELGLDCINLGIAGGAMDTAFRLAYYWLPKIKPSVVVHQLTTYNRVELFYNSEAHFFLPNAIHTRDKKILQKWYHAYLRNDINGRLNYEKNRLGIEKICNNLNIKYVTTNAIDWIEVDRARDLLHYGRLTHKNVAQEVIQKIKEAM